jgi:hypothetical protein
MFAKPVYLISLRPFLPFYTPNLFVKFEGLTAAKIFRAVTKGSHYADTNLTEIHSVSTFSPEDGESMFFRDGVINLRDYTASQPRTTTTFTFTLRHPVHYMAERKSSCFHFGNGRTKSDEFSETVPASRYVSLNEQNGELRGRRGDTIPCWVRTERLSVVGMLA